MRALLLVLMLAAVAASAQSRPGVRPQATQVLPRLLPKTSVACEGCHDTQSFESAKFNHDKTGFPLLGAHQRAQCKGCHPAGYEQRLPGSCVGCHVDPHAGDLGHVCQGCHDETSWESRFDADAHRRTAFPLVGRHAAIPCQECHGEMRERRFSRRAVDCVACHLPDYNRTRGAAVDHARLAMSTYCRECHGAWRWSPARYPAHDVCLNLSRGEHVGLPCLSCHVTIPQTFTGTCRERSTACTACHEHQCSTSDGQHTNVSGYECRDRKCFECHRIDVTQ